VRGGREDLSEGEKVSVGFKELSQQPTKKNKCYLSTLSFKDMCCSMLAVGSCEVDKTKSN